MNDNNSREIIASFISDIDPDKGWLYSALKPTKKIDKAVEIISAMKILIFGLHDATMEIFLINISCVKEREMCEPLAMIDLNAER